MGQVLHKEDWQPWHDEINRYARRETQGLTKDIEALEAHIKKLREVAPKDRAGYPYITALTYIDKLQGYLDRVKSYVSRA